MKYVLVVLAFLASSVYAFQPNELIDAEIKAVGPCKEFTCMVVEKDNKQYVVMGEVVGQDDFNPMAIYIIEGKKLRLIWSIAWKDI